MVSQALRAGRRVLQPGVRPSHLAALDAVEALIAKGEVVAELDLTEKKLRGFPARVLELRGLRRLVLRGNDLGALLPRRSLGSRTWKSCCSHYDELYALYGNVDAMGHLRGAAGIAGGRILGETRSTTRRCAFSSGGS
ncbi:MAG: hypothetical protein KF850_02835 [Labilithrix sp.]|nr:hypothetical protein [Labilithrix sp.]